MKLALLGFGKMGKTIEKLALSKGHTIVYKSMSSASEGILTEADVAIEFSNPESAVSNITKCFDQDIPVVCGTTGWLSDYDEVIKLCKRRNGSFIYASNFSVGVNLFFKLNSELAKLMQPWETYEVAIEEIHHTEKKDAPSGTAITIAEGIVPFQNKTGWTLEEASEEAIKIIPKRIDDVKGTHTVSYTSAIDTIKITHEAHSRDGFAKGAILAAEWLQQKKGVFTMKDVLGI
ncbi:4-hydroxy-tetrahydrodipicolinate reductase [Jejudonia soesokkakensis]|uniref:4-hydroxy-tetrahydrodipicolinate reductase n=1 Tax=Jejudonia soesokkakensis TaxID=1323432 RepID=A0ABW2MXE5_9FLAO